MKMTDYAEEQSNELEALEAIYPDSFTGVDLRGFLTLYLTFKVFWLLLCLAIRLCAYNY